MSAQENMKEHKVPEYRENWYRQRGQIEEDILDVINRMSAGELIKRRTINVLGERGVGKTWFLLNLNRNELRTSNSVTSVYIDFEDKLEQVGKNEFSMGLLSGEQQDQFERQATKLMAWLAKSIGAATAVNPALQELEWWIKRDVPKKYKDRALVLLLDGIYSQPDAFLSLLEERLLSTLAAFPRALLVMSGRGEPFHWKSADLRLYAIEMRIEPFDRDSLREVLKEQLGKQPSTEDFEQIWQASGGFPLTARYLAEYDDFLQGLNRAIENLLIFIPEEKRKIIREYLEAISILNQWIPDSKQIFGFRERAMEISFSAYFQDPYDRNRVRAIRDELLKYNLIRPDHELHGYVIDAAIRYPIAAYLMIQKPDEWWRLHERIRNYYSEQIEQLENFPDRKDSFKIRITAHNEALQKLASESIASYAETLDATYPQEAAKEP